MITPQVDAQGIRQVMRALNQVEPTATKDLRKKLQSALTPIAKEVAAAVPREAPLSGLGKNNKWGWQPKNGRISFTPGKSRLNATSLVSVRVNYGSKGYPFGVWIAEFATNSRSTRGSNLIRGINSRRAMKGKGGRYAYDKFRTLRPKVVEQAVNILNVTMRDISRKIK
jgi:hypothetical protein